MSDLKQAIAEKIALDHKLLVEMRENIALRARNVLLEDKLQEKDKQIAELQEAANVKEAAAEEAHTDAA